MSDNISCAGRRALITGITGQDGSYLAELLLSKGYQVWGGIRRSSTVNCSRIEGIKSQLEELIHVDLLDQPSLCAAIEEIQPHEVYNLAAQSFVPVSWSQPVYTSEVDAIGVTRLLEAIRTVSRDTRLYQASSSEMFGKVREVPQTEQTPFYPRSPYGVAKCYGHHITVNYRESYDIFACSGILFNHTSPRRGVEFVEKKITRAAARIKCGEQERLELGNIAAQRDWGAALDYVRAMWMMLQHDEPGDYVIATGKMHSVKDVIEIAFEHVGLDWDGYVDYDQASLMRPAEVDQLLGDASKAREVLGWKPEISFENLIKEMVDCDL